MPGGNGTGPMGAGPMTGRGAGFCAGYNVPGYANPVGGRGFFGRGGGFGRGMGMGRGRGFGTGAGFAGAYPYNPAPAFPQQAGSELDSLKQQAGYLEESLTEIRKRIETLEKEA